MKKLTSRETFSFNAGNDEILEISPEGTLASDEAAALAVSRFGGLVTSEDADIEAEIKNLEGGNDSAVDASESMSRPDLESMAEAKGIDADTIKAAKTKKDLVAVINNHKADAPAATTTEATEGDNTPA